MGPKFIQELKRQGAALQAKEAGWMILEMANIKTEDGIEKRQRVKLKLRLSGSYVCEAEFTIYDVKGFDILLRKWWMRDINQRYQIDHDSNEMWIADNLWEEWEDGRVLDLPGLRSLDVDEEVVEQAKFMSIHIIRKVELENLSARLLKRAFLIKVHHRGDGGTVQTDEHPGEFQEMLTEFNGLFRGPTFANSQNGRQADLIIITDPYGKLLFRSPYRISPQVEAEVRKEIDNAICCCWIQPSRSNFGSPVLIVPKPDGTLHMCIDNYGVKAIPGKDRYPLPHIEDLLNSMHGSCRFTKFDFAAGYHQICITTADRQKMAITTISGLYEWRVLPFSLANAPSQFMRMMNSILEPMKRKFIVI